MSINFSNRLSAITTDSAGVTHIVWVEDSTLFHAEYDNNSATWVNQTAIASIGNQGVVGLNLIASDNLIEIPNSSNELPGLVVVYQQGSENESNFFYTAAQYDGNGKAQWLDKPQALSADQIGDLEPRAIATEDGTVFVVGQKVNSIDAQNQGIREDSDLYYQSFSVSLSEFTSPPNSAPLLTAEQQPRNLSGYSGQNSAVTPSHSPLTDQEETTLVKKSAFQGQKLKFTTYSNFSASAWEFLLSKGTSKTVQKALKNAFGGLKVDISLQGTVLGPNKYGITSEASVGNKTKIDSKGGFKKSDTQSNAFTISLKISSLSEFGNRVGSSRYLPLTKETTTLGLSFAFTVPIVGTDIPALGANVLSISLDAFFSAGFSLKWKLKSRNPETNSPLLAPYLGGRSLTELEVVDTLVGDVPIFSQIAAISAILSNVIVAFETQDTVGGETTGPFLLESLEIGIPVSAGLRLTVDIPFLASLVGSIGTSLTGTFLVEGTSDGPKDTFTLGLPYSLALKLLGFINFKFSGDPRWTWPQGSAPAAQSSALALTDDQSFEALATTSETVPSVAGNLLTIPFSTPLNSDLTLNPSEFTVRVTNADGTQSTIPVFDVIVQDDSVILRLESSIPYTTLNDQPVTNNITVSYTGNQLNGLTENPVTVINNSSQTPVYVYDPTSGTGTSYTNANQQITITFNAPLNTNVIPDSSQFVVTDSDGVVIDLISSEENNQKPIYVNQNSVVLTLNGEHGTIPLGENYTVQYTPKENSSNNLESASNQDIDLFSISNSSPPTTAGNVNRTFVSSQSTNQVLNKIENDFAQDSPPALALTSQGQILLSWGSDAPNLLPISALAEGSNIYLTFGENLSNNQGNFLNPKSDQFTVTIDGVSQLLSLTVPPSVEGNTLVLTLAEPIADKVTSISVAYNLIASEGIVSSNLAYTDLTGTIFWLEKFADLPVNLINDTTAPTVLGLEVNGNVYGGYGLNQTIVIPFDQELLFNSENQQIPSDSFNVSVNNLVVGVLQAIVNPTSVVLTLDNSIQIGQGDTVSVNYKSDSNNPLRGNNNQIVASFSLSNILTTATASGTVIKTAFSPFGDSGISLITTVPNTNGLNFDVASALTRDNVNVLAWVQVDNDDLTIQQIPGQGYTEEQSANITTAISQSDVYYSILGPDNQWSLAQPIAPVQTGQDQKITLGEGPNGDLIATWLNTQQESNGDPLTTIYWSSFNGTSWTTPQTLLSEISPDAFSELNIRSVNGQPAIFWTETPPASYSDRVTELQPLVYLRLAELSGTTAINEGESAPSLNGTYSGNFKFNQIGALDDTANNSGDPNPAVLFEGGGVTLDSVVPISSQGFSVEFWFQLPNINAIPNLVSITDVFQFGINDTELAFSLNNSDNSTITITPPLEVNTWYYVVGTYDGTQDILSLYLNGELVGSLEEVTFTDLPPSGTLNIVGQGGTVIVDEVAFYNSVLTYVPSSNDLTASNATSLTGSQFIDGALGTDEIGNNYISRYNDPAASGPEARYSVWNPNSNSWEIDGQIEPIATITPTTLNDANYPVWDIVSATDGSITSTEIFPNGEADRIFQIDLVNQQGREITGISVTVPNTLLLWGVGEEGNGNAIGGFQVGVILGETITHNGQLTFLDGANLLNSLNPNVSALNYKVMGETATLNVLIDETGNEFSTTPIITVYFKDGGSITPQVLSLPNQGGSVPSDSIDGLGTQVLGVATVTEANDASLANIDSGFVIDTNTPAIGSVLASAFNSNESLAYVAVGNRGYTDSEGNLVSNGTVQILFPNGSVLQGTEIKPLTTTDLSGNPGGGLITGIADGGTLNSGVSMSLATGDIDSDGIDDLVIGDANANGGNGAIYVIYGSYLTNNPNSTIDVSSLNSTPSNVGYVINPSIPVTLTTLSLGFTQFLNPANVPSSAQFAVSVNNTSVAVSAVEIQGERVILTLANNIDFEPTDTLTIAYTSPSESPLETTSNTVIPSFSVNNQNPTTIPNTDITANVIITPVQAGFSVAVGNFDANTNFTRNDIAFGAPGAYEGGAVYIAYNGSSTISNVYPENYPQQATEQAGFSLAVSHYSPGNPTTFTGSSSSDDLLVGAPGYKLSIDNQWQGKAGLPSGSQSLYPNSEEVDVGAAYVLSSGSQGLSLWGTYTGPNTPAANGVASNYLAGFAIASEDLDGDGRQDLGISALGVNANAGAVYVISGDKATNNSQPQTLNDISNLIINGSIPSGEAGTLITTPGDMNGDGYQDFLITAPQAIGGTGQSYLLFGPLDLDEVGTLFDLGVTNKDETFLLNGSLPGQLAGTAAIGIGNITGNKGPNNQAIDSLLLTAPDAQQLYTVYGQPYLEDDGSIKLANISSDNGFVIDGAEYNGYSKVVNSGIPNQNTDLMPSIVSSGDTLYMAVKGEGNDPNIYITTSADGGKTWSPAQVAIAGATNFAPSLAIYNDVLYLAYTGLGRNQEINLLWSTDGGQSWSPQYQIGSGNGLVLSAYNGPTLVVYEEQLFVIHTNRIDSSSGISYVYSNNPQSNGTWSSLVEIPGLTSASAVSTTVSNDALYIAYQTGTAESPGNGIDIAKGELVQGEGFNLSWTNSSVSGVNTNQTPGLTSFGSTLYLTSTTTVPNVNLPSYMSTSTDGTNWTTVEIKGGGSTYPVTPNLPAPSNFFAPSPVVVNDEVYLVSSLENSGYNVLNFQSPFSPFEVVNPSIPNQETDLMPSIVNYQGTLYMAVKGEGDDQSIYITVSKDGGKTWLNPEQLAGITTNLAPSLAVYDGVLYLAYTGTDNRIYILSSTDALQFEYTGEWGQPYQFGQFSYEAPELVVYQDHLLTLYTQASGVGVLSYAYSNNPQSADSWSSEIYISGQTSANALSATVLDETLYIAYQTGERVSPGNSIDVTSTNSTDLNNLSWAISSVPNVNINQAPGITSDGTRLYVTSPNSVSFSSNGTSWTTVENSDSSIYSLSPVVFEGQVNLISSIANSGYEVLSFEAPKSIVRMLGDINGDGFADVFAGGNNANVIVFGDSTKDLLTEASGTGDLVISVLDSEIQDVINISDFNGDGLQDFGVIDDKGDFYIVLGNPDLSETTQLTLTDPVTDFSSIERVIGIGNWFPNGYNDLLIGGNGPFVTGSRGLYATQRTNQDTTFFSQSELIFISSLDPQLISTGTGIDYDGNGSNNLLYSPTNESGFSSRSFSEADFNGDVVLTIDVPSPSTIEELQSIGDFNGDGIEDLAVLVKNFNYEANNAVTEYPTAILIYYGDAGGWTTAKQPDLNFVYGADPISNLAKAGDLNGDGFDDFLASSSTNNNNEGSSVVVFGGGKGIWQTTTLYSFLDLSAEQGFIITGLPNSEAGSSISGGGDVNGDGFDDLIIGAPGNYDDLTYVLFGSDFNQIINQTGTIGDDVMLGTPTGESFVAGQGDDEIYTHGGLDVVYAGPGDDFVSIADTFFRRIDGGTGLDVLELHGYNGQNWDISTLAPGDRLRNFEVIDIRNYGVNQLTLNSLAVRNLSSNNTIVVLMDSTDNLVLSSDFSSAGTTYQYGDKYYQYTASEATVLVNQATAPTYTAPDTITPTPILPSGAGEASPNSLELAQGISSSVSVADNNDNMGEGETRLFVSNPIVANEVDGEIDFTIQRTGDLNKYVQAYYISQDGRAKAGNDYSPVLGRVVFAPGETSKTVSIPLPLDDIYSGTRGFGLLVTPDQESDTPLDGQFSIYADPDGQIRNWNYLENDRPLSVMDGELEFRITTNDGTAEVKLYFEGDRDFNSYYSFNEQTQTYEPFEFNGNIGAELFDDDGDGNYEGVILHLQDGSEYDLDGSENGIVFQQGFLAEGDRPLITLNKPMYRFRNTSYDTGVYLYAGETESESIKENYGNFVEEGLAFYVSPTPQDGLIAFNRFQNTNLPGTYLYAGETESESIRENYANFVEEGIAFYAYPQGSQMAATISRFQNGSLPGTYLYTGQPETDSVINNYPNFNLEGIAFEAIMT